MEEKVFMSLLLLTLVSLPVVIEAQITFAKGESPKVTSFLVTDHN